MADKIYVLDFGNQYLSDIVDYIKQTGYQVETVERGYTAASILADAEAQAVVLLGGYETVYPDDIDQIDPNLFKKLNLPILATGRGMQAMIHILGGTVTPVGEVHEPSPAQLTVHNLESGLFKGLMNQYEVQLGYDAAVSKLPEDFVVVANGPDRPYGAIENKAQKIYGVQFELNVKEDTLAQGILSNFCEQIVREGKV